VVAAGGGASLTDFLGLASTTAALLAAGYGAWRWSAGVWKRTVGSRKTVRRQLDGMACGVTLAYVENRLGHPAFRRPCFDLVELTWRLPHAWFCGLVSDDSLVSFAVTVTDPRFGYDCRHLTFGNLPVTLGRDTLAAGPEPGKTTVSVGARRFYVTDEHYFGNPGAYQHYLLAYNDQGVGSLVADTVSTDATSPSTAPDPAETARVRAGTTANTLIVGGAYDDRAWRLWGFPGVDGDFVRTLRATG